MENIFFVVLIAICLVIVFLLLKKNSTPDSGRVGDLEQNLKSSEEKNLQLEKQNASLGEQVKYLRNEVDKNEELIFREREEFVQLKEEYATSQEKNRQLEEKLKNNKKELLEQQEVFIKEFERLASNALQQNSERFNRNSQEQLKLLLNPLEGNLKDFKDKIEKSNAERLSLKDEVRRLAELNTKISEEATNLANALKGDTKKQGNWGEFILIKILEASGLERGREYDTQFSTTNLEGNKIQPDVIVHLPDEKDIIIDAKVSLVAYEKLIHAEEEESRRMYLKQHLLSIRSHIKLLSQKAYETSKGLITPDFVFLFLPIESSFSIAVKEDNELFQYAWDNKIVIVSPTTLLASLRTIASVWKQEKQTRNALNIAEKAGALYDKFAGFVVDMELIGKHLDQSKKTYDDAFSKLTTGKGNLIGRAEKIKELGAKTKKEINRNLLEDSEEEV